MNKNLSAIILAAGKGSRMNSKTINKVALQLADKPMILHTVELFNRLGINNIVVVVGFAKKSVMNLLNGGVVFAEQKKRLGTAHAVSVAIKKVSPEVTDVLVVNGDDSAFYKQTVMDKLIKKHYKAQAAFTFLTIEKDDPTGLGRVVRDKNQNVLAIIEEKDATQKERLVTEVNPGCYIFNINFLKKYLKLVRKSKVTGEYYLTGLISLGIENKEKIETLAAGKLLWRGVNTHDELKEADMLIREKS